MNEKSHNSKDILDAIHALKIESNVIDHNELLAVLRSYRNGDFSVRLPNNQPGIAGEIASALNESIALNQELLKEFTRVGVAVGQEGQLSQRVAINSASGHWYETVKAYNTTIDGMAEPVDEFGRVVTEIAKGNLTESMALEIQGRPLKGEFLRVAQITNQMITLLNNFSSEVTRVSLEVGTEGILGGQARIEGVSGVWLALTSSVNQMADNLTSQVRNIATVAKAVADGDLSQKITVEVKGEVLELKNTVNNMVKKLTQFSSEVTRVAQEVGDEGKLGGQANIPEANGIWMDLTENVNKLADNLTRQIRAILAVVNDVTQGNLTGSIDVVAKGEVETLKNGLNQMIQTLKYTSDLNNDQDWLKTNLSNFSRLMQGKNDLQSLATVVVSKVCPVLNVQQGVFYALDQNSHKNIEERMLLMIASYAFHKPKSDSNNLAIGQGLVGQAALEKKRIIVENVPTDYIQISSGLGNSQPLNIVILPVVFEGNLIGVMELGSFTVLNDISLKFLDELMVSFAVVANSVLASVQTENLLIESQSLSEELQIQQEELKNTNIKLETQAKNLIDSEIKLKTQQEELQQTNEELEEKSQFLAEQKKTVEHAKSQVEEKAIQLGISSKYKSEFLANMSHELRTPLNSLMVLSDSLRKNIDKNLSEKQLEKLRTIHESGIELLELINEILDLAKIESGKMSVQVGDIFLQRVQNWAMRGFQQMAENKGLVFESDLDPRLPKTMLTDEKRLQQVIKNFISNAIKFTDNGTVNFSINYAQTGWSLQNKNLNDAETVLAFSVTDSGIGIPANKQQIIFEAFQQADGSTSRKYGGTGLGLSISREIASLLAGEIVLESEMGKGSKFTLYIPHTFPEEVIISNELDYGINTDNFINAEVSHSPFVPTRLLKSAQNQFKNQNEKSKVKEVNKEAIEEVEDDRININSGDKTVLIVEDDINFAKILLENARENDFKGVVATSGDAGLMCAQEYTPDAIILDIKIPIMNGWTVLDRIKHDAKIRHIPVHIISGDEVTHRSLMQGAISCLQKPINNDNLNEIFVQIKQFHKQKYKQLLVVENNDEERTAILELIGNGDVNVTAVATIKEAQKALNSKTFHCMVLDSVLLDKDGMAFIESIKLDSKLIHLPIIIYTGKELTEKEEIHLNTVAESIIVKKVKSPERLLDETALFLHRVESNLPEHKRQMIQQVHENDPQLWNRTILIVDDDVRNIFTLTSIFEAHNSITLYAQSGKEAIEKLESHPEIEIVLMDIMMPEMDGYETMKAIRKMEKLSSLPIIAVTAKAMIEDRQKCLDAGASDYIVKPVDTEQLLSLVRVWLYKDESS